MEQPMDRGVAHFHHQADKGRRDAAADEAHDVRVAAVAQALRFREEDRGEGASELLDLVRVRLRGRGRDRE